MTGNRSTVGAAWLVAVALTPMGLAAQSAAPPNSVWRTPWSYEGARGPAQWAKLDPAYAACDGKAQSPVDIRRTTKAHLPALRFEYRSGPLTIVNNGYTAVRVNYAPGNGNLLVVGDKRYELTQFHFHHPSEEELDGKRFAMIIHLMHRASDGEVVGVAVPVVVGAANATVERLWPYMPRTAGDQHAIPGVAVDPSGLLPSDLGYYTYAGSQTAPPCTEGVRWFVLKTPVTLSAEEIDAFAALYPHDVRPVQPLNGRVVQETP